MDAKPGRLVKALYDFPTDDAEELSLQVGDIVQVTERIDKQWSRGVCGGREGNFPLGFTVDVKIPELSDHQQLFAATSDFAAQENGDLTLTKGDLIIGNHCIDSNWWNGVKDGVVGIFPITHVWKVNKTILPIPISNKKMFAQARVKMSMTAQLPEEMDLHKDEIVNIIEEVEKGWYRGECNGRHGIFPASFVTILQDSSAESSVTLTSSSNPPNIAELPVYENNGYDCINSGITAYGRALYPFQAEYSNELNLKVGEIVNLIKYVDDNWIEGEVDGKTGIFPSNFINVIVDCPKPAKLSENSSSACEAEFPPDTYGRVIFDFHPQLEGDVRFKEGDTVTLIRKIDKNWYEVETDNGESGVCPESYIEVIGSGPPSYSEVMGTLGGQNLSVIDNDSGFCDHAKNSTKSGRPLSFASSASDSSFSSQSSANEKSGSKNSTKFLDDKVAENLIGLESSFLSSETSFSDKSSNSSSKAFGVNTSQGVDSFNSTYNSTPRQFPNLTPFGLNNSRIENFSDTDLSDNEIQNQIQMKGQTLKQRLSCLNKLENEMKGTSNTGVSSEIKTQISQLNDDIDRLKREIESLNAKLQSNSTRTVSDQSNADERRLRDEEVAKKRELENKRREKEKINKLKEMRECIITELLQTEKDYVSDLKLLRDTFLTNPEEAKSKGINIMALFGNLDEVISVANRLLSRLQKVSRNDQLIGECFVDMSVDMKKEYGLYCRNHDEANAVLDKIDSQSSAGQFINHKLEVLQRQTNCFDLGAMLIKPVQRILKYPLLLDQLLKCTDDCHPDKAGLKQAIGIMSDVATAINEFKRQKDLVSKYRKQTNSSLSGRMANLNYHSFVKKLSRSGMRLSATIGLNNVILDEEFEKIANKFKSIEKHLHIFLKDLTDCTKKAEELYTCTFNMAEGIAELYQERKTQQEVVQFRSAHQTILTEYWVSFKQTMDCSIHSPIKQLLQAYTGPKNLIEKRADKLLDYLSSTKKLERNKDATKIKMLTEAQLMNKNIYEALNSQLLTDLPKLYSLSVDILCDCIRCFLRAKKNFVGQTARHMMRLMDLPLMLGSKSSGILETFHVKHTLIMDELSHLSIAYKQFQSCLKSSDTSKKNPSPKGGRLSIRKPASASKFQTASQKAKIKSTYCQPELYTACENFEAVDFGDISLKREDVVGVIKQQDPMGNKTRWFVDSGAAKGFIPTKCLMKFLPEASLFTSAWDTPPTTNTAAATSTVDLQNLYSKPNKNSSQPQRQTSLSATPRPQTQNRQNFPLQPQAQKVNLSPQPQVHNISLSSQPQPRQNISQTQVSIRPSGAIQPTRPAPPVSSSLRTVAPSRYPPAPQSSASKSKDNNPLLNLPRTISPAPLSNTNSQPNVTPNILSNMNSNSNALNTEPIHRYEEIPDSAGDEQNRLLSDISISSTINVIDEFDPYSSSKGLEVYDNVPGNLNSMYSTHRYEDIPEGSYYEEVPSEPEAGDANEYYYGMYDFAPNGPNQLLLKKGQVVLVLHKCDLNQNSQWWFVEDRHGNKGYVPAIYLNKYSKDVAT